MEMIDHIRTEIPPDRTPSANRAFLPRHHGRESNRRERIAPLSVLPVFVDLRNKPALVAGGSAAAAWKAHLLAAAGARLRVVAPALDPVFAELFDPAGLDWQARRWRAADLFGVSLAIADGESPAEAEAFFVAARRAGTACNVIDRPDFSTVQFGTIVNRSPVVVGISTAGAAPILGQAVRRRIETVLPDFLAQWAGLAQRLRAATMARLRPGAGRRAFWERLAEAAFAAPPVDTPFEDWIIEAGRAPQGCVTLIGAGSGAADLMTLRAVRVLHAADVILYDQAVPAPILELGWREAGRFSIDGDTEAASRIGACRAAGQHVVLLVPGDGTGRREKALIEQLAAEGIAVATVPGVAATPGSPPPCAAAPGPIGRAD